jgi:hypothetical protein
VNLSTLEVPLVKETRNESTANMQAQLQAAMTQGPRLPKADVNYAEDPDTVAQVRGSVSKMVQWIRRDRQTLEAEWRAIMRMEWMVHDDGRRYVGRSNAYLPIFSRIHQTLVSALSRGLFPSDEYMDVVDRSATPNLDAAKAAKTYLQWEFERIAQVRKKVKPFLRSLSAFGNAPLKYWYCKETVEQGRNKKTSAGPVPEFAPVVYDEGLRVSPRNLFHWFVYPYTAESLDEATMIFEDVAVPRQYIQDAIADKRFKNGDAALRAPIPDTWQTTESTQLTSIMGLSTPQASPLQGDEIGDIRVLTEVWTRIKFPASAYMDGEDPDDPVPARILLAGDVPVEIYRNPYWHQRPPYLFSRLNSRPGLIYGYGSGRMCRPLQYLSNDFANQTADCASFALNPITVINPNYLAGPLRPLSPGVTWYMTDVDHGVKFERPPMDIVQGGQEMINLFMGLGMDLTGAPPQIQGVGGGAGGKTATQSQILQNNAMQPLQDIVEDIEQDLMVPLMIRTWINAQQYREQAVMAMVGGQPLSVDPRMLGIDPEFRWLASSQAMNQAQRAQQLMAYLTNVVFPAIPVLNQMGVIVNPVSLMKKVLGDGFGMRIPPDLFMQMGVPPGTQPGMVPPGVQEAQGNAIRSAVEQAPGGSGPMAQGEGEAFTDVRNQADNMAAMMGGNNGKF